MTLNKVVNTIKEIAENHKQIKTIYFGDFVDFLNRGEDNIYPALFYDVTNSNINGTTLLLNFDLYFMDRMLPEDSNETEILSDMLGIVQDFIAEFRNNVNYYDLNGTVNIQFFNERTPDLLAGCIASISIELPYLADRCVIPYKN